MKSSIILNMLFYTYLVTEDDQLFKNNMFFPSLYATCKSEATLYTLFPNTQL